MLQGEFRKLFLTALNRAAEIAENKLGNSIPRLFKIELHAPGSSGNVMTSDQALDKIYLDEERFYIVIDVAVKAIRKDSSLVFVRVSGHLPAAFSMTYAPSDLGPFKQLIPEKIEILGD